MTKEQMMMLCIMIVSTSLQRTMTPQDNTKPEIVIISTPQMSIQAVSPALERLSKP
ncbi:hypothetical protein HPQ61_08740, partial [Acetobacteraceae bacterium]|nr:hypothetical protein [Acetobacteraceae bacterium]